MRTIKLTISYDGTGYAGWQLQKNGITIQEELEKALAKVLGKKCRIHGASRTDAGVHALAQVAHFKTFSTIPGDRIPLALNKVLPFSIAVLRAEEAGDGFHSRFDAVSKEYRYHIINTRNRDPFSERYACRIPYELDVPLMRKEALVLIGEHDFRSFQARDKRERSSVREIYRLDIHKKGRDLRIDIEGNGFLYNMVRNVVGTLIDIGRGYLAPGSMRTILESRDRTQAGPTAPAKGLFLIKVRYPEG